MSAAKPSRRKTAQPAPLILQGELRLNAAADLQKQLDGAVRSAGDAPLDIQAEGIDAIDTAGLQLLAAFAHACRRRDIQWRWQGVSDALRQGSRLLGLDDILAMPATPAK